MGPRLVYLEGNIGAGKSTLLDYIQRHAVELFGPDRPVIVLKEPVEEWTTPLSATEDGILQLYYRHPLTYGSLFQAHVLICRLTQLQEALQSSPNALVISERSPFSGQMFAEQLTERLQSDGSCDVQRVMTSLHTIWMRKCAGILPPAITVYLRVAPDTCLDRVRQRQRSGERNIDRALIDDLHARHEATLLKTDHVIIDSAETKAVDAQATLLSKLLIAGV